MNKLIKGSIAGAAGIALLLGGAGTFAFWSDTAAVAAGEVTSGVLDVANKTPGTWDKDIALIVPGDSLTFTDTLELTATGDNLKAAVTTNAAEIVNGINGIGDIEPTVVVKHGADVVTPVAGVYTLGAGEYTVDVSVVVNFPAGTAGQVGQNQTTDLSALAVTVTQVAPTTP